MSNECRQSSSLSWTSIPNPILTKILKYVKTFSWKDFENTSLTCRHWYSAVNSFEVWKDINVTFISPTDHQCNQLKLLKLFGSFFENLIVRIDQSQPENRRLSVEFLKNLANIENRRLQKVTICFVGENPLFYGGQEFVEALHFLFGPPTTTPKNSFVFVDLCKLPVKYADEVFYSLTANHCLTLTYLDLQNKQLICQLTPTCVRKLVDSCKSLSDLRISHSSASNEILKHFSEGNRKRLNHFSLLCRRQDKYEGIDLTDESWCLLVKSNPNVKVTLKFDYSCTVNKMIEIMKPAIPVYHLFLECYCTPLDIFNAGDYYRKTLRKLVVQAKTNPDLNSVMIDVAQMCPNLKFVHIMCVLEQSTIDRLYEIRPAIAEMCRNGKCTLKSVQQPHPWVSDEILDDIPLSE